MSQKKSFEEKIALPITANQLVDTITAGVSPEPHTTMTIDSEYDYHSLLPITEEQDPFTILSYTGEDNNSVHLYYIDDLLYGEDVEESQPVNEYRLLVKLSGIDYILIFDASPGYGEVEGRKAAVEVAKRFGALMGVFFQDNYTPVQCTKDWSATDDDIKMPNLKEVMEKKDD